jgi:hypothetical protein
MSNKEQAVREAAAKLMQAIKEARAEGLVIAWPAHAEGLATIAVSAGRRALTPDEIGAAAKAQAEREQGVALVPAPAAPADVKPATRPSAGIQARDAIEGRTTLEKRVIE